MLAAEAASRLHPVATVDHHHLLAPHDDRRPRIDALHQQFHMALVQASRADPLADAEFGDEQVFDLAAHPEADWCIKGNGH